MTALRVSPWYAAVVLVLAGCGDRGPRQYEVSGTVTYGGKPVPYGTIDFEPDASAGNRGPGGRAEIRDGHYATAPDRGVVGGPYVVRICGSDGMPLEMPEEGLVDPAGTPLFEEHVEHVDLPNKDTTRDFAVPQP
jgi:hypothetical protein